MVGEREREKTKLMMLLVVGSICPSLPEKSEEERGETLPRNKFHE